MNSKTYTMSAQRRFLMLCNDEEAKITRCYDGPKLMPNGVVHYSVELICKEGTQYAIEAFGDEAVALYNETMMMLKKNNGQDTQTIVR